MGASTELFWCVAVPVFILIPLIKGILGAIAIVGLFRDK